MHPDGMSRPVERWFVGASVLTAGRGGIARVARMTARSLIDAGANVRVLSLIDDAPVEIAGVRAATARGSRTLYAARCHAAALARTRFLYDAVGPARAHPRLPGLKCPYGVWIHGVEVWDRLSADRARALRDAAFVLANSRFTLERFNTMHWSLANASVCWLATEDDEPPPRPPAFQGRPTVLVLGRIDEGELYKGHTELIQEWPRVSAAVPDARLLIVGGGSGVPRIKRLAEQSPAQGNIEIRGFVPEAELSGVWGQAHVFAMPSRGEGFGLVYIEAMRHGLPVIASIHDAGQEVNVDAVTGYNVHMDRPADLVERIVHLLRSPEEAHHMGQAGLARWREHFRYSAFAKRLLERLPH
jgi:phosphatidyl-myo-inositol dimannoside synthase